jgi:hypothetical protein
MADQCQVPAKELNRASSVPCHECPWRESNKDRPVPAKYADVAYTRDERVEMWAQMRAGHYRQSCHMTTSDRDMFPQGGDPEWTDAGFSPVPEHAQLRECAGAVALAERELRLLRAAGSFEKYHEQRPHGFTREAASLWALRMQGRPVPGYPPLRRVEANDAEILDPTGENLAPIELLHPAQVSALLTAAAKVKASLSTDVAPTTGGTS